MHLEKIQPLVERNTSNGDGIAKHSTVGVPERSCFASPDTDIDSRIMLGNNTIENNIIPKRILFYSKSSVPTTPKECTSQKTSDLNIDKFKGNLLNVLNYLIFFFFI